MPPAGRHKALNEISPATYAVSGNYIKSMMYEKSTLFFVNPPYPIVN